MYSSHTPGGRLFGGSVGATVPFYVAGPTCVAPGNDVFGRMYDRLVDAIPDADFLAPEFRTPGGGGRLHGQIDLLKHAMSHSKFQGLLRSLRALAPLCLPLEEARRFTTYS